MRDPNTDGLPGVEGLGAPGPLIRHIRASTLSCSHTMPQPRLLVIDDDLPTGTLFRRIAEKMDYSVEVTDSAVLAQEVFTRFHPQVIILDLVMPDVDGIEMVRWLTGVGFNGRVIMVSGYSESYLQAAVTMLKARGVEDAMALTKPISVEALRECLASPPAMLAADESDLS